VNKEELYLSIINNLSDGIYFVNANRQITFWNAAAEEITGYKAEEVLGSSCGDNLLNHIDASGRPLCVIGCPLYATMVDGQSRSTEVFFRHKSGHRVPVQVKLFPMRDGDKIIGAIEIFTPNSPTIYQDTLVEQLSNMAMHDELTGLANRRYLQSFLDYRINEFKRFTASFAVLFLDIDNFGAFNNTYGHDIGDIVLQEVAKTVQRTTRKSDMFGRWGGEEFVGIYAIKEPYDAPIIAEKIRILIENTQIPHDPPLSVTVSVGITVVRSCDTVETLIERADKLMYQSKEMGKNRITQDLI